MSEEWPDTVYCLEIAQCHILLGNYLCTDTDDWKTQSTDPVEITDHREYLAKDEIRDLMLEMYIDEHELPAAEAKHVIKYRSKLEDLIDD